MGKELRTTRHQPPTTHHSPPSIILVRPQMGENIGAAARAMMNFGLRDLRLVAPRDGWPNPKAHEMSAHADVIIEAATVYDTVSEALAECDYVLATTARPRDLCLPVLTPREAAKALGEHQRTAIIFGPERSGLTTDEVALAHAVVTIPTDAANSSLNIAQSVVILGYEWWQESGDKPTPLPPEPLATHAQMEGLLNHLVVELERKEFFHVPEKKASMQRNLRTLLTKAKFNAQEVQTLRGIVKALAEG